MTVLTYVRRAARLSYSVPTGSTPYVARSSRCPAASEERTTPPHPLATAAPPSNLKSRVRSHPTLVVASDDDDGQRIYRPTLLKEHGGQRRHADDGRGGGAASSSSSGSAIWSRRRDEITFDRLHKVSNLSHLSKLAHRNNTASRIDEADKLHTAFLAIEDARAVLIKLADKLHNMRTFDSLPKIKQLCFAKETLELFAPLANQLGILNWKEQLENMCFKYLYPEEYEELSSNLLEFYNRDMIAAAIRQLEQALRVRGLSYHVISGRHMSMYSIYNKMTR